ncbi:MAG: cupin domain-containing protein [Paracoccus sp. (in: a-proteobacteria)]|uniref:(R)-mandelonitrile lyase n=1 Tax=Paracoccus sp. TaxID=267 RepID=UPI0026E05762|nr:cupin domain-containing protein [Paracoccus sp. (in: a-proteobacteria)]MDO5622493.1 cupin domain-containing protein [Paracoccus sp. (in: a-proteobacteria)]
MTQADLTEITKAGTQPAMAGLAEWFTSTVSVQPLFGITEDRSFGAASVTFLPGARTHWHTHPKGQTMIVTAGVGWTQTRDGVRHEFQAGDVIWCPADIPHWHGATDCCAMTHIALNEARDGSVVTWLEPVTDAEYLGE